LISRITLLLYYPYLPLIYHHPSQSSHLSHSTISLIIISASKSPFLCFSLFFHQPSSPSPYFSHGTPPKPMSGPSEDLPTMV